MIKNTETTCAIQSKTQKKLVKMGSYVFYFKCVVFTENKNEALETGSKKSFCFVPQMSTVAELGGSR